MAANFKKAGKSTLEYLKKHPTLPVSVAALGIGVGNLTTNVSRRKEAEEQNKKQIKAMENLSNSLSKVSASFDDAEKRGAVIVKEKDPKKSRKFRIGFYSDIAGSIFSGAALGGAAGTFINGISLAAAHSAEKKGAGWGVNKALNTLGASILIGAGLGLLLGVTRQIAEKSSRDTTNDRNRIINVVSKLLKKRGFKEGSDFTTNPKTADQERTRVTVLVNRSNGDLKLALNVIADPKLEKVCNNIILDLPEKSKSTKRESNRYNEILITSLSEKISGDALLISNIVEKFIRAGYPVYMIEVG